MLSRLVDDYDQIAEESLGSGDPEFHEIEDRLYEAIVDSPYRAVIKHGDIYHDAKEVEPLAIIDRQSPAAVALPVFRPPISPRSSKNRVPAERPNLLGA